MDKLIELTLRFIASGITHAIEVGQLLGLKEQELLAKLAVVLRSEGARLDALAQSRAAARAEADAKIDAAAPRGEG